MKAFLPLTTLLLLISSCSFAGGKDKNKNPNDTAKRKYKSTEVSSPSPVKTASGLEYTITSKGEGPQAEIGDIIKVHYTGKLTNDTVFDTSMKTGQPISFKLGQHRVIQGWEEAFALLHAGDKATLRIPASLGYGPRANGKIPANSELIFDVELLDVTKPPKAWSVQGKDTVTTASGLKYVIVHKNASGKHVKKYDKVKVDYAAYLTNGKLFDSSVERGQPLEFNAGMHQSLEGWDEGLLLLNVGDSVKLIIPPALGLGAQANGPVPANSTIIIDMAVLAASDANTPKPYSIKGLTPQTTQSGVKVYFVKKGTGAQATTGKTANVQYTGYFENGDIFDSSVLRGGPGYPVTLGAGGVVKGWEEALLLTHAGDKIHIVVPYAAAYGDAGRPPVIPPKTDLTFDMEVTSVQ